MTTHSYSVHSYNKKIDQNLPQKNSATAQFQGPQSWQKHHILLNVTQVGILFTGVTELVISSESISEVTKQ